MGLCRYSTLAVWKVTLIHLNLIAIKLAILNTSPLLKRTMVNAQYSLLTHVAVMQVPFEDIVECIWKQIQRMVFALGFSKEEILAMRTREQIVGSCAEMLKWPYC